MKVNCRVGVFFLIFDKVLGRTGRLSKFRPRDSESESDSSTYTKSELFADEASEKEVESFKESGLVSTSVGREVDEVVELGQGSVEGVVVLRLGLSGIEQTQLGLHVGHLQQTYTVHFHDFFSSGAKLGLYGENLII